jgi:hypothetical protein
MKYIKVFEKFDEDYIKSSIDDIFVELKDEGMLVKTYHHVPSSSSVSLKKEFFDILIKGKQKYVEDHVFTIEFDTSHIKSYVDTLIDFMSEFCTDFDYHIEEFDKHEHYLSDGKEMNDWKVGSVVITFTKK